MAFDNELVTLLGELADAFGPSGFEDDVLAVIRRHGEDLGEIREDKLRNLYIYRKENTGGKPVMMLDAHSDEVGMMVQAIKPNGTLRFLPLGGWNKPSLPGSRVLVRSRRGEYLPGVIAAKPVHFMSDAEQKNTNFEIGDLCIDIGASSAEEAVNCFGAAIGEPVSPAPGFRFRGEAGLFFGKGFDCRIGCAALLETLRRLRGKELPFDIVGVFSSQEEVGDRGVQVSVETVKPDVAVCFEGCPADDTFTESWASQTALHRGPMLRYMDRSVICSPRFMRYALELAENASDPIPVQCAVREGGGNNGAVINLAAGGVPVIVAGVPVRYIHSPNCIAAYEDLENTVRLAVRIAESMTKEILASF